MIDLFGNVSTPQEGRKQASKRIRMETRNADGSWKINPLHGFYGVLEGKKCKNCSHMYAKLFAKKYLKCDLRNNTAGPSSDHRANWTACGKYMEDE